MADNATFKLTPAQRLAVETVGRNVLVTASAGTGKTAALSWRCVQRICDATCPVDVDRLLVLTFTDAAAEEMRARIASTLRDAARQRRDSRLRRQAMLLDGACISTIHAFCKRVLTEFFHATEIDPAFAIIDEDEQRLLKSEVLESTLEAAWQDAALAEAMRVLFAGRRIQPGTRSFVDKIIPLSAFLDSVAGREAFYERAARINDAGDTAYAELLAAQCDIIADKLAMMRLRLDHALVLDRYYCGGEFISDKIRDAYIPAIEQCHRLIEQDRFADCAEYIKSVDFKSFPRAPKDLDDDIKKRIKAPAEIVKKEFKALSQLAALNPAYDCQLAGAVTLHSRVLLELLRRFDAAYAEAKAKRNVLDFADLEHHTLRLLESQPAIARALQQRFDYVFVDEYQDINTVQQRILDALCRGDNVFAVGDIKQSIYAFRQSRPDIFLDRLSKATDRTDEPAAPLRVDMAENFRSRREVLDFVNTVFGRIMTDGTASMRYDKRAELKAEFEYAAFSAKGNAAHPVELILLDQDSGESKQAEENDESEEENADNRDTTPELIDATQRQAAFIARRIRQMVGADDGTAEFQVYDRTLGCYRDVRYGDIVILMRSLSFKANTYVEVLRLAQIPVNAQNACGYFETTEISDCVSLLKTLDNPNGDVETAAALRSPLFGFSDTELAEIRLFAKQKSDVKIPFYQAVRRYAENGPNVSLQQRLGDALRRLGRWRRQAQRGSLAVLLDEVFRETNLVSFYAALPNGSVRRANLLKLHDRAIQFERFRTSRPGMGLARFVEFLEKLQEEDRDWAPGQPDSLENAVRIMSVHKSKGLEFPVVFAAELNTPFNTSDQRGECLIDEQTIGLQTIVEGGRFRLSSPAHQVLVERKRQLNLAEEMRILYVMLTRAREKLVLTASQKDRICRSQLTECALMSNGLTDWKLREARCHLDWILAALACEATLHTLYKTGFEDHFEQRNEFVADRIDQKQLNTLTAELLESKRSLKSVTQPPTLSQEQQDTYTAAFARLESSLTRRYPFSAQCGISAKYSVSTLTHRDDEFSAVDVSGAFDAAPSAVQAGKTGPADIHRRLAGSAAHLVFEHVPLGEPVTDKTVKQTLAALVKNGLIAPPVAEQVDVAGIAAFFATAPGAAAVAAGTTALREWPFTLGIDATELGADAPGETVLIQGIVDLIIPVSEGLIIVDFKTDRIADDAALQQRIDRYRQPLAWYARAASTILKKPAASCWLYFADCRKAVSIDPNPCTSPPNAAG
ncbi:MAG TPA: helicase-exonuclease AddAB subunit AddA [Phycisphaerales bacterium]|nr:helicase-exonuclease AddAB subunit AddA [Phycisphaerales bacterium]